MLFKNNDTNNMKYNDTYVSYMVPLTEEIAKQNEQLESLNIKEKNIKIPPDTCPLGYSTYSENCNVLYIYCKNIVKELIN